MEIYDTEYKNLTYKELFTMLEGLKNTVLNSYDEELFFNEYSTKHDDFHNILCVYKKVLQEFHNRICDEMSTKLGTTIYPTNVAIRYTDMKNTITNNGKISLGEYDHREDVVYINLLVNPVKANNFQFKKFVNNWTMEMLNTLFHETFHHIQQSCFTNPTIKSNEANFIKTYLEANLFCHYESADTYHQYKCNMLELDARKFALESLEKYCANGDIPFNCDEYFQNEYFTEIAVMGKNFEYLKTAQARYKLANMNYNEKDYRDIIDKFYSTQTVYFSKMLEKAEKINTENLKLLPNIEYLKNLSITQINALTNDYQNYLQSKNKSNFLQSIIAVNNNIGDNDDLIKFKSLLPTYLNELNKEKSNTTEKE